MAPNVGLLTAPAAQIAIVQSLTPLLTAILGMMLLRERLRIGQWLGLALGVAGVALVVKWRRFSPGNYRKKVGKHVLMTPC